MDALAYLKAVRRKFGPGVATVVPVAPNQTLCVGYVA